MQRDHYLPLKVIREHLDAVARGERPPLPAQVSQGPQRELLGSGWDAEPERPTAPRIGRTELLAATEAAESDLDAWEAYGLIAPMAEGGYDSETVNVAKLVAELGRFGLEPRHLRSVKAAADREPDCSTRSWRPCGCTAIRRPEHVPRPPRRSWPPSRYGCTRHSFRRLWASG